MVSLVDRRLSGLLSRSLVGNRLISICDFNLVLILNGVVFGDDDHLLIMAEFSFVIPCGI